MGQALILFHGKRHPMEMGETEVAAFLTAVLGIDPLRASQPYIVRSPDQA